MSAKTKFSFPHGLRAWASKTACDEKELMITLSGHDADETFFVTIIGDNKKMRNKRREFFKKRNTFKNEQNDAPLIKFTKENKAESTKTNSWTQVPYKKPQDKRSSPLDKRSSPLDKRSSPLDKPVWPKVSSKPNKQVENNSTKTHTQSWSSVATKRREHVDKPMTTNAWSHIAAKPRRSPLPRPNSPNKRELSNEEIKPLEKQLMKFKNDIEQEIYTFQNLSSAERKWLHIRVSSLEIDSKSDGSRENRAIVLKKRNFLNKKRKNELMEVVLKFKDDDTTELYFDIKNTKEAEFVQEFAKKHKIDYTQVSSFENDKVRKHVGETCWGWVNGTCSKDHERCEYEHKKTKVCRFWREKKCKFQNQPEKCMNVHKEPEITEDDILEIKKFNTWKSLPDGHSIQKNEWYSYVDDVHRKRYICQEGIRIPFEKVIFEENAIETDNWAESFSVVNTIVYKDIVNPLFYY